MYSLPLYKYNYKIQLYYKRVMPENLNLHGKYYFEPEYKAHYIQKNEKNKVTLGHFRVYVYI